MIQCSSSGYDLFSLIFNPTFLVEIMEVDLKSIFLSNVITLYVMIFLVLIIGRGVIKFCLLPFSRSNMYLRGFIYLLTGTIFLVFAYSVFMTHFKTINLGFILLFLFAFVELRKHNLIGSRKFSELFQFPRKRFIENREFIIFLFLMPALLCLWQVLSMSNGSHIPFMNNEWMDNIYFGRLSGYLNTTGEENTFLFGSLFCDSLKGGTPYHYFELWINAFAVKCFGINNIYSLLFVTRPLLLVTLLCGMLAITQFFLVSEKRFVISFLIKCITILLLFFSEINWHSFFKNNNLSFTIEPAAGIMWINYQKTVVVLLFIVLFFLCVLNKKYGFGIIALLFLPICYSTNSVVLIPGLLIALPLCWLFKIISRKDFLRFTLFTVVVSLFSYFYYQYFGNRVFMSSIEESVKTYPSYFSSTYYLADAIYLVKIIPFATCLGFLPWAILLILGKGKKSWGKEFNNPIKIFSLFTVAFFITGLLGWPVLRFMLGVNASQLFYTLFIPFSFVLFLFLFNLFIKRRTLTISSLFIAFILLTCINYTRTKHGYHPEGSSEYSQQYIESTYFLYKQHPESPIVFLSDSLIYSESSSSKSSLFMPLKHFAFLSGNDNQVNIDVFNMPPEKIFTQQNQTALYLETSVFYQYCQKQKEEGRFVSPEKSQLDFIKEYHVKYMAITQRSVVNPELQTRFDKIIEDKNTGDRFISLK